MDEALPAGPRVVVGIDDSPASRWALVWAVAEARLRGVPLVSVHVSRAPIHPTPEALPCDHGARAEEESRGVDLITRLFDDVAGGVPDDLRVVFLVRLGEPWHHLAELARPGDLLVVGRGARRGLGRLLLPSTRRNCTRYARATVVVVAQPVAPGRPDLPAGQVTLWRGLHRLWTRDPGSTHLPPPG